MHPILQNEIKDETDEEQIAERNNTRVSQEERDKTKKRREIEDRKLARELGIDYEDLR